MMNNLGPAIPHAQPAVPLYSGRRNHDIPYSQPPAHSPYPHPYQSYHQPIPQHHYQPPPTQWYHYQSMQTPMPRPYQQYYPMVSPPYSMPHNSSPMPPRPPPLQQMPSSSSTRLQQSLLPLTSTDRPSRGTPLGTKSTPAAELGPTPLALPPLLIRRMPFYPPLPWFSVSEASFPPKAARRRRRRHPPPQSSHTPVELPARKERSTSPDLSKQDSTPGPPLPPFSESLLPALVSSTSVTPTTSRAPSEADSTQPTTPSSVVVPTGVIKTNPKSGSRPDVGQLSRIVPVVPVVPSIPSISRSSKRQSIIIASDATEAAESAPVLGYHISSTADAGNENLENESVRSDRTSTSLLPEVKAVPKSWADLVRNNTTRAASNGLANGSSSTSSPALGSFNAGSLSEVLASFNATTNEVDSRIAFLKPRGLVNTGNMCYMNAVLQVLVFCIPFYKLLDLIGKQAVHRFKSHTPLVDAMIMFMHEFPIIDSAVSVEQLRLRLKANELEQYGDPFTPEFVYEVIRRLPRFSSMRRGHQQDAEEFLGFLLEEMHDECTHIMGTASSRTTAPVSGAPDTMSPNINGDRSEDHAWLEVGPKQKSAITRLSGIIATESPINKIFGGKLRSELRVPGAKNSVTLEPYQPLQLDIGSPQVNNITDALKGLTRSEVLHGEFSSPRGPGKAATKQIFIDTLPPVLVLHLKRFQYDNAGGTQKIWRKIGYPLELEIPKEVFPQHKRGTFTAHPGLPKYRLIGVVYHHGKNASGGHYTVDVRRQDGREWIRLDDTVIQRIRSEDVAEGGSEEDPRTLAKALEQHRKDKTGNGDKFDTVRDTNEGDAPTEAGWSQANGGISSEGSAAKAWSGVIHGMATPTDSSGKRAPVGRFAMKDNKVAYILFYQRL